MPGTTVMFNVVKNGKVIPSELGTSIHYILDALSQVREVAHKTEVSAATRAELFAATSPPIIRQSLQAGGIAPLNVSNLLGVLQQSQPAVSIDLRANRTVASLSTTNTLFVASDLNYAMYVSDGAKWFLVYGRVSGTLPISGLPTLDSTDNGLLFDSTDFARLYKWTNPSWADDDTSPGRDFVQLFRTAPGTGWRLCDGTVGVTISKSDGTTATITLPTLNAATFLRGNAAYSGPAATAAAAPGLSGSTAAVATGMTVNNNTTGITLDSHTTAVDTAVAGAATRLTGPVSHTVTDPGHNHAMTDPTHLHGKGTLAVDAAGLPKLMDLLPYLRL